MTSWPTDSLSDEWLFHLTDWQTRYQTSWWQPTKYCKAYVSSVLCLRRSSTCLIPTQIFVSFSDWYSIIVWLETEFIILLTDKLTDLLVLLSHGLADTYRSANHLTDWNRNVFELCFRKTRESCNKFPLNHGSAISIISNGKRTEWINKSRRPWSGSPIW